MVAQCAWLTIEPHPHVLPVILTAGPNLFLFSRRFMASSNALHWLRCDSQVAVLSGAARRRLVCSILLQVADAVQHIHSEGAMHLDLKPDNVLVAVCDSIDGTNHTIDMYAADGTAALETRVLCQLCDWELSSMFEGVPGARSGGGTPGFWAPEQVTPLPVLKATTPLSTQAVEHSAMSLYWRQVCLDPQPTPAQPERVSTLSDSWGLATLLLALTEVLPTMRLDGFTRFRHSLCKSARRLGGTHVGDPAAFFLGSLPPQIGAWMPSILRQITHCRRGAIRGRVRRVHVSNMWLLHVCTRMPRLDYQSQELRKGCGARWRRQHLPLSRWEGGGHASTRKASRPRMACLRLSLHATRCLQ